MVSQQISKHDNWRDLCRVCQGKGHKVEAETRSEMDYSTGIALGAALGIGLMPIQKQVKHDKKVICRYCNGTVKLVETP